MGYVPPEASDPHDDLPPGRYPEIPMLGTGTRTASTPEEARELHAQLPEGSRAERLELQRTADPNDDDAGPVRQDGRATDHEFQPRWWRNDLCAYPGCGAPQTDHIDGEDAREKRR